MYETMREILSQAVFVLHLARVRLWPKTASCPGQLSVCFGGNKTSEDNFRLLLTTQLRHFLHLLALILIKQDSTKETHIWGDRTIANFVASR